MKRGTPLKIMYCLKFVEKDRPRTRNISRHSLVGGDGASKGRPAGSLGCPPEGPFFPRIVQYVFNGHCDSSLFLLLVDASSMLPSPK